MESIGSAGDRVIDTPSTPAGSIALGRGVLGSQKLGFIESSETTLATGTPLSHAIQTACVIVVIDVLVVRQ